tara:strand:- start:985 stop:1575 length:591 start_codon:yes stop_codon:yes gene_type:complete
MNEGKLTDLVMERKDIPPMAKIVMRAILRRVDWKTWTSKEGHKIVSTRELAARCGTTKKTIIKNISRLEKVRLIERNFFKAKPTQAPPIRVLVDNILNYENGVKSTPQGGVESIPPRGVESTLGEVEKVYHPSVESIPPRGVESIPLSIKDNSNTIINTINNTSVVSEEWGVNSDQLWGDDLRKSVSVVPVKGESK